MSEVFVRFGEADLTTCDREPIHIPGSIYPHGALLVIDRRSRRIEQVAGDTKFLLGIDPERILGLPMSGLLEQEALGFLSAQLDAPITFIAPVIRLGVRSPSGSLPLDLTLHAVGSTAIVEFEPARRTATSAGDPIAQLKTLLAALQGTASLAESFDRAAVTMRSATGFDRAMVYRFLPDGSGVVVAEDARAGLESFLGLHYPASDIPKQARELYRRNWLRAIPDVDYQPAPLRPALNPQSGQPVDMSHCTLRSVSPIHLEYLRNMGVSASLSASIVCQDQLWGMLVLHHYAPRHVSADLRVACETFAQVFSLHVEAKTQAETSVLRIDTRRRREELVGRLMGASDLSDVLATWDLLGYVGACGGAIFLEGHLRTLGETPPSEEILALVSWLNTLNQPVYATDNLCSDYPPAAQFSKVASGLLALGVSRDPRDYVLWFRPEFGLTVRWAGNPSKSLKVGPLGPRLTPRGSFAEFLEKKSMHSVPWSEIDIEAAEALRVVLLESILKSVEMAQRERALVEARVAAEELERRVAQRTEQLRRLASELEAAENRERQQIARDLHDDLSQTLATARIRLTELCTHKRSEIRTVANAVGALIDLANNSTRSLAAQLSPAVLYELGLRAAIEWLAEEIENNYGLKVTVVGDESLKPLAPEISSILYRAVRELLINAAKHAQTDLATVTLARQDRNVLITVSDSGVGYEQNSAIASPKRGLGLSNMRERLSLIGGSVSMQSRPGTGTIAVLTAPLDVEGLWEENQ
jgi:light-regulated signal transduction histidine kinase (bacteriophytochrome)